MRWMPIAWFCKKLSFTTKDGIDQLAQAIREANEDRLLEVLEAADFQEIGTG